MIAVLVRVAEEWRVVVDVVNDDAVVVAVAVVSSLAQVA